MKRFATISLILCLQSGAPAFQSAPAPVTCAAVKDTYVKSDQPTASFGGSFYLSAEEDGAAVSEQLYIQFDTTGLAGKTVVSAAMRLWVQRENGGGGLGDAFEIVQVNSLWTDGLTWNLAQAVAKGPVILTVPAKDYGAANDVVPSQKEEFDVTSLVQAWAAGTPNEGLMIRLAAGSKADFRFGSMESPEKPTLLVTFGTTTTPPPPPSTTPPPPPPPAVPRTAKVGNEDDRCGCGSTSPDFGGIVAAAVALALILAARRS
jgi:hypothetical protein